MRKALPILALAVLIVAALATAPSTRAQTAPTATLTSLSLTSLTMEYTCPNDGYPVTLQTGTTLAGTGETRHIDSPTNLRIANRPSPVTHNFTTPTWLRLGVTFYYQLTCFSSAGARHTPILQHTYGYTTTLSDENTHNAQTSLLGKNVTLTFNRPDTSDVCYIYTSGDQELIAGAYTHRRIIPLGHRTTLLVDNAIVFGTGKEIASDTNYHFALQCGTASVFPFFYHLPDNHAVHHPTFTARIDQRLRFPGSPVKLTITSIPAPASKYTWSTYKIALNPSSAPELTDPGGRVADKRQASLYAGKGMLAWTQHETPFNTQPNRCRPSGVTSNLHETGEGPTLTEKTENGQTSLHYEGWVQVCFLTEKIAEKINITDGIVYSIPFNVTSTSSLVPVENFYIHIYANDIRLTQPLQTIDLNRKMHNSTTTPYTWPFEWIHPTDLERPPGISWYLNGPRTASALFPPSATETILSTSETLWAFTAGCRATTANYARSIQFVNELKFYNSCRAGTYRIALYYEFINNKTTTSTTPNRKKLIREYIGTVSSDPQAFRPDDEHPNGLTSLPTITDLPEIVQTRPDGTFIDPETDDSLFPPFTPVPPDISVRDNIFTSEAPYIQTVLAEKQDELGRVIINVLFKPVAGAQRYEIEIDQPTADETGRSLESLPVNNPTGLQYQFTTLSPEGQLSIRLRGSYDCPTRHTTPCSINAYEAIALAPPGSTAYSRWTERYYLAIGLLGFPERQKGTSVDPEGKGRWEGTAELQANIGGLATTLLGLDSSQNRNIAILIWAALCILMAASVYVKAWHKSGLESGWSPSGAGLATLTLIFMWSILGYVFFDLKSGTVVLPIAGIIFIAIVRGWNTVKG